MDIIPVLDILDYKVVKAINGDRANYEPVSLKLYNSRVEIWTRSDNLDNSLLRTFHVL